MNLLAKWRRIAVSQSESELLTRQKVQKWLIVSITRGTDSFLMLPNDLKKKNRGSNRSMEEFVKGKGSTLRNWNKNSFNIVSELHK